MKLAGACLVGLLAAALPAAAQMDSRDAIALQNQILELRAQMQAIAAAGDRRRPAPTVVVVAMAG